MGTEINDGDTLAQIGRLLDDIPRHAQRLLEVSRQEADSALNPDLPAQVEHMEAEIPGLVDQIFQYANQYRQGRASAFDAMLEHLEPAWHHIEDMQVILNACQIELQDWSEAPVSNVSLGYLVNLHQASTLHCSWMEEMGRAIEGYRDLLVESRYRAFLIFEAVDWALQSKGEPGGDHLDWAALFELVTTVSAAIVLTPIPAAGVSALKVVSFLVHVGTILKGEPPEVSGTHVKLSGATFGDPSPALVDALDRLTALGAEVQKAESSTFEVGFQQDINATAEFGGLYRDPWAGADPSKTPGVPGGDIAVDLARLYRVAVEMLPAAAYGYQRAAEELESLAALEKTAFGSGDTVIGYSRSAFEQFRAELIDCLHRTRNDLLDVGSRLEEIAQNLRMADERSAEILDTMNRYVAELDAIYVTVAEGEAQRDRQEANRGRVQAA